MTTMMRLGIPSLPHIQPRLLGILVLVILAGVQPAHAQSQSFRIVGRVTAASFSPLFRTSPVNVGDRIIGTLVFHSAGYLSSAYQVGTARFAGDYPSLTPGAPDTFHAQTDLASFGGRLPAGVGYFPDALSGLDIVNRSGTALFYGLAFVDSPVNPGGAPNPDYFTIRGDVSLSPLVPEPASLSLLAIGMLPLGAAFLRRQSRQS
jgi:hypothetical protein